MDVSISFAHVGTNVLTIFSFTNALELKLSKVTLVWHLPVVESDQYGPVELVLGAVGPWAMGVDEGVNSCQYKAL